MKTIPSSMQFEGYHITKALYSITEANLPEESELELKPTFMRGIEKVDEGHYLLSLGVQIGNDDNNDIPFAVELVVEGSFTLKNFENEEKAIKMNAVAILFPYLRSTLSMFTSLMNINPIILPTINPMKMFENEDAGAAE